MVRNIQGGGSRRYADGKWSVRSTLKSRYRTQTSMFTFRIAIFIKKRYKRQIRCQLTREFTLLALIFTLFYL